MNFWIDTHAHVYSNEFDADRADVIERSREQGVQRLYLPNVDHTSIDGMLELEEKYPEMCYAMMGLHPCSVKQDFERELYTVEEWLSRRTFTAIGEMGTDLYWDKTYWGQQVEAFKIQTAWARQYHLPLVIHCRESLDETIALVESLQDGTLTGVFHCFNGTVQQAERIRQVGFYLGIGGVSTFKNAGMDKVIPEIGLEQVVLETDSPYLAPVPHRGKRNEPMYIPLVGQRVADLLRIDIAHVQERTTQNALTLFRHDQH